nr:ORF6N domain-containing protein [uncultured Pedobacter sp.]
MTAIEAITQETIQNKIFTIRGKQVMIDRDLAVLYGVETKVLNQAVRRNLDRFPENFMFQLNKEEFESLRSQFVTLKDNRGAHSKYLSTVFTEHGVLMLSSVLRSETALKVSIQIMNAFVEMRRFLRDNAEVFVRLENVERKQLRADENFDKIFNALQSKELKPKQGIFYDGQVFDAYSFIADLVREAKTSIVLIDNYVDDTVLRLFAKRKQGVSLTIYTKKDSILNLDIVKYKTQYGPVGVKEFKASHDRFLILDGTVVYHIGASLKDLGLKWFAFSKMEIAALDLLSKIR